MLFDFKILPAAVAFSSVSEVVSQLCLSCLSFTVLQKMSIWLVQSEEGDAQTIHPNKEQLSRRHAIVPDQVGDLFFYRHHLQ